MSPLTSVDHQQLIYISILKRSAIRLAVILERQFEKGFCVVPK